MPLIEEIQAGAISETSDVSALLRKCKLLAARLDAREFAEWVDHELNGYPTDAELPSYRLLNARSYGNFVGPFDMRGNGLQIPLSALPESLRESYRVVRLGEAISAYQSLLERSCAVCRIDREATATKAVSNRLCGNRSQ